MTENKEINQSLADKYGRAIDKQLKYRLVLNDQTLREHRYLSDGKVLREADVLKYSYIPEGTWILERLSYNAHEELDRQSYEPIWVFVTTEGRRVEPNLRACVLVIESTLRGAQEVMSEDEEREKSEQEQYEALGGNAGISDKLIAGEGIQVPSNYERGK